jgi:hypothetical protein
MVVSASRDASSWWGVKIALIFLIARMMYRPYGLLIGNRSRQLRRSSMSIKQFIVGAAVVAVLAGGGVAVDVASAPEAQAACYGSVSMWQGKNHSCPKARHWDAIKKSSTRCAPWVGKGSWSRQGACWANVVSYGMTAR